ncbi:MAG TPA: phospholipid carrier-dependent glycosyltransferase [Polyangia bacterium]
MPPSSTLSPSPPSRPMRAPVRLLGWEIAPEALVTILASIAIAMGVLWRGADPGHPNSFTFDEYHFVENARNYLKGQADWNDHPPLGKLLMLPGIVLFGDNGWGWRFHAALLGCLHIALMGFVAAGLFCSRRAGWLTAAFVAIDGLFVSYSRTALLDIPMNTFMMASLALMLHARSLWWFAGAAVALGLGVAVKWIAVCLALVVPLLLRRKGRSIFHALWMGVIAVVIYGAVVAWALAMTRQPITLPGMVKTSLDLLAHHAGFTEWRNPADSRWYTWPFLWKPILLFRQALSGDRYAVTSTVGNPVLWYLTTAAFVATLVEVTRHWGARLAGRGMAGSAAPAVPTADAAAPAASAVTGFAARWERLMPPLSQRALALVTSIALLLQWILTKRESYIWHYMGTYGLGLALLAGMATRWSERESRTAGAIFLVLLAVSAFYAPVWMNVPLSATGLQLRLLFPLWR